MSCLDDRRLLELHYDTFTGAAAQHVAECASCTARLRALRRDLARIDLVLRTPAPRTATRVHFVRRWAPLALAAAAVLAIVLHRMPRPAPADLAGDDTIALADELTDAMATDVSFGDGQSDRTAEPSTCVWGDPLLGVGCDEPAVMRIAWR